MNKKITDAIRDFQNNGDGNYPKFITITSKSFLEWVESHNKTSETPFYTVIPLYIDDRIKEDFLLNERGL